MEACCEHSNSYATYDNRERISQLERSLYVASAGWMDSNAGPFCVGRGSFWVVCRKAGSRPSAVFAAKSSAHETIEKYGRYMRMIEFILRRFLRVLGPQKYLEFAKYMRHQLLPSNHFFLLGKDDGKLLDSSDVASLDRQFLPESSTFKRS